MLSKKPKKKPVKKIRPADRLEVNDPELIQKLRLITAPPKAKPNCLDGLSDEQLSQVFSMLVNGHPKKRIAEIIMGTWGCLTTYAPKTVESALQKLTIKTIGHRRDLVAKTSRPRGVSRSVDEKRSLERIRKKERVIKAKLDEIQELGYLIFDLKDEFEMWRRVAVEQGQPLKYVSDTARLLLDALDKYTDLRVKLGLLDIRPKRIDVNVRSASVLLQQTVDQPDQIENLLSSFKSELELIAGPRETSSSPDTNISPSGEQDIIDVESTVCSEMGDQTAGTQITDEVGPECCESDHSTDS